MGRTRPHPGVGRLCPLYERRMLARAVLPMVSEYGGTLEGDGPDARKQYGSGINRCARLSEVNFI